MSTIEAGRLTGEPDGARPGLSLEAIAGQSRRLDELSCARVLGHAADAVHAAQANQKGQPLGTVTPASIIAGADGKISIVPAGSATAYTAPEKLRGAAGDRRSDVFALGVVLWEALVHARLFDGADDAAVKQAVLDRPIAVPSELNANVPAELDAICKKALAREPADRYASAKVMAAEIDAMLGDAGYPESNDQIAAYIARSQKPDPIGKSPDRRSQTLPPASKTAPLPLPSIRPPGTTQPPPSEPPRPASSPRPGSQTMLGAAGSPGALSSSAASSSVKSTPSQPLPPVVEPSRPPRTVTSPPKPAKTEIFGSLSTSPGASPFGVPAIPSTAFDPEAPTQLTSPPKTNPGVAVAAASDTLPNGSFSLGAEVPTQVGPPPVTGTAAGSASVSFAPPEMPPPIAGSAPVSIAPPAMPPPVTSPGTLVAPVSPSAAAAMPLTAISHPPPSPSDKPSLANADTLPTPQLPAHLAIPASQPPSTLPGQYPVLHSSHSSVPPAAQLSMPPGMTVAPISPPAALHSADPPLAERAVDPIEVVALRPPQGPGTSRDVLAGWGWTTGATAIVEDHDSFEDDARASRKRLLIAIGGALAVVVIVAIIAFAAGGAKPAEQAAASSTAAAIAPPTAPAKPAAEPSKPDPASANPIAAASDNAATSTNDTTAASAATTNAAPITDSTSTSGSASDSPSPASAPPAPAQPAVSAPVAAPPPPAPAPPAKPAIAQLPPAKKPAEPKAPPKRAPEKLAKPARPAIQPLDPYAADKPKADASASYRTGLQQLARGDTGGALVAFRTSVAINPGFAPAWRGIGLVYEKLGNRAQARQAYRKYLQLAPDAVDVDQIHERMERLGS